jgi:hypothetical protein
MTKKYSESKLASLFKTKEDIDVDNLLPKSLIKDLRENSYIINTTEDDDYNRIITSQYTHFKYQSKNSEDEKFKMKHKFSSTNDVRRFAQEYKNQLYSKFENVYSDFREYSTNSGTYISCSPNDSSNASILEDFNNFLSIKPVPKRFNSNLDVKKIKTKNPLLGNNEKDEKCEEFEDINDLLSSINCELWIYAKTQKGSRNLQKLLNKIDPEELDIILEKVKKRFPELMADVYGNYFCQKLIQSCSAEQRMFILRNVTFFLILDFKRIRKYFL